MLIKTKIAEVDSLAGQPQRLLVSASAVRRNMRNGASMMFVICAIVLIALVISGVIFALGSSGAGTHDKPIMVEAIRDIYEARVLDQGEVQSSENYEFRCEVKSRYGDSKVIWVIDEGSFVQEGDVLLDLDTSKLEEALQEQEITVNTSNKLVKQAESALAAAQQFREEYFLGTFVELERTIQNEIFIAEQELRSADQILRHSERLAAKSYVTDLQLESDRFEVDRAQNALDLARKKLEILRDQTHKRMEIELDADIVTKEVELANERYSLEIEENLLAEINDQIIKCKIIVPEGVSGQVVFANKYNRRGTDWVLEEGATVIERQALIRLPNPDKMEVRATVNESQIASVEEGQIATVRVDARNEDVPLNGRVVKVNPYAEPDGWGGGGVRKYAVYIEILDPPDDIRPGMNASVSILIERQESAVQVPVQCLYERRGDYYCVVELNGSFETREVKVGSTNDKMAWVTSGVNEGDMLVMAPRKYPDLLDLPGITGDLN